MPNLLDDLQDAKNNVRFLLDHIDGSVDIHGLEYWAKRVVELRKKIKEIL